MGPADQNDHMTQDRPDRHPEFGTVGMGRVRTHPPTQAGDKKYANNHMVKGTYQVSRKGIWRCGEIEGTKPAPIIKVRN